MKRFLIILLVLSAVFAVSCTGNSVGNSTTSAPETTQIPDATGTPDVSDAPDATLTPDSTGAADTDAPDASAEASKPDATTAETPNTTELPELSGGIQVGTDTDDREWNEPHYPV